MFGLLPVVLVVGSFTIYRILNGLNLFCICVFKDVDHDSEMQKNARNIYYDQLIEMYDLKNIPSTSTDRIARRNSRATNLNNHPNNLNINTGDHIVKDTPTTNITMTTTTAPNTTTTTTTCHRRKLLNTIREETSNLRDHLRERKTVNFIVKNRAANKLRFGKKIYEFYNAPITKFWQHTIIYILFLISFAYIVLVKTPKKPSMPEIFVIIYVFSYGLDKIRELLQTDTPRFSGKIKIFFSKVMNCLDMLFILSIVIALIFRLIPHGELQKVARIIYCVNTIYWIIKLFEFLLINKYAGVLIIIASRMVRIKFYDFLLFNK